MFVLDANAAILTEADNFTRAFAMHNITYVPNAEILSVDPTTKSLNTTIGKLAGLPARSVTDDQLGMLCHHHHDTGFLAYRRISVQPGCRRHGSHSRGFWCINRLGCQQLQGHEHLVQRIDGGQLRLTMAQQRGWSTAGRPRKISALTFSAVLTFKE